MAALPGALPAGCRAVRALPGDEGAALRLCVLVRTEPDLAAGVLVGLGDRPGAAVFLGCITDAAGRVRDWLEWWVQDLDRLGVRRYPASLRDACSNALLDRQWAEQARTWRKFAPDLTLETGWEEKHPPPIWLDLANSLPVNPSDPATGAAWELCQDDAALAAAQLPPYSLSLHRYLWQHTAGSPRFLPMTAGAPVPPGKKSVSPTDFFTPFVPFNPAGGLMKIRRLLPMDSGQFADLLSGAPWPGFPHGRETIPLGGPDEALRQTEAPEGGGFLLPRAERLAERFHHKVNLVLGTMRAACETVRSAGAPLLDLSSASFRIRFPDHSAGVLPFLWNAEPILVASAGSVAVAPSPGMEARWHLPLSASMESAGRAPEYFRRWASGSGTVRLGALRQMEGGGAMLEGTLAAGENLPALPDDLLCLNLRLGAAAEMVQLFAQPDLSATAGPGEIRFRTLQSQFSSGVLRTLKNAGGVVLPGTAFEVIPALGVPCDLYALGVLAVRFLLINDGNALDGALDEIFSLARLAACPGSHDPALSLEDRLEKSLAGNSRWLAALGPQRLSREGLSADEALQHLPPVLWVQTLAAIIRCFPALDPESFCSGYGDTPDQPLEAAFDAPIRQWETIARLSRSLVLVDWRRNREILAVIDQCRML